MRQRDGDSAMRHSAYSITALRRGIIERTPSRPVVELPRASDTVRPREVEIITLLARGMINREIGRVALVSEGTVKFHLRSIMAKLAVHHRAEVVYAAGKLGRL